jgi:hypothetical protein
MINMLFQWLFNHPIQMITVSILSFILARYLDKMSDVERIQFGLERYELISSLLNLYYIVFAYQGYRWIIKDSNQHTHRNDLNIYFIKQNM